MSHTGPDTHPPVGCPKPELRAILLAIWAVERMSKLRRNLSPQGGLVEQREIAAILAFRRRGPGRHLRTYLLRLEELLVNSSVTRARTRALARGRARTVR